MKLSDISMFIISTGLMCVSVNAMAVDEEDMHTDKPDCSKLSVRPDQQGIIGAYKGAIENGAPYVAFQMDITKLEGQPEVDPKLVSIVKELNKPNYINYARNELESRAKLGMSSFSHLVNSQKDVNLEYIQKALACYAINAYVDVDSNENQQLMFSFQQLLTSAFDETDPERKAVAKTQARRYEADRQAQIKLDKEYSTRLIEDSPLSTIKSSSSQNKLGSAQKAVESGDPDKQFLKGMSYEAGPGGTHNPQQSMIWFRKSAEQGNGRAQYFLGSHYLMGDGVPVDKVQAYVWFSVSAANGYYPATQARDVYGLNLSESQRAAAQELAKQYFEKYQPHH